MKGGAEGEELSEGGACAASSEDDEGFCWAGGGGDRVWGRHWDLDSEISPELLVVLKNALEVFSFGLNFPGFVRLFSVK